MSHVVGIMQPYLFPYLGYLQLMQVVDEFIFFDTAQYIRRGWINRNRILLNGEVHTFTVPIVKCPRETLISQVQWNADIGNRTKLLKTISQAYRSAPFVQNVLPWIERTLLSSEQSVSVLIEQHFVELYEYLGLDVNFYCASSRNWTEASGPSERILAMCQDVFATGYVNPINGQSLYTATHFSAAGISLQFLEMSAVKYPQIGNEFTSHLSLIDVLMMNSPQEVREMLGMYHLKEAV